MRPSSSLILSVIIAIACPVAATTFSGCAAVARVRGEYRATLAHDVPTVTRATAAAIEDLKLPQYGSQSDALTAIFRLHNARGDRITITLAQAGEALTDVRIQVGNFGDPVLSRSILDAIKQHL